VPKKILSGIYLFFADLKANRQDLSILQEGE